MISKKWQNIKTKEWEYPRKGQSYYSNNQKRAGRIGKKRLIYNFLSDGTVTTRWEATK